MTLYTVAALAVLISMALAVARAVLGPTVFDRILAVNMFGTKSVLLVAVFAFLSGRPDVLDIALLYSLLNFLGVVAALRFVERGEFYSGREGEPAEREPGLEAKLDKEPT